MTVPAPPEDELPGAGTGHGPHDASGQPRDRGTLDTAGDGRPVPRRSRGDSVVRGLAGIAFVLVLVGPFLLLCAAIVIVGCWGLPHDSWLRYAGGDRPRETDRHHSYEWSVGTAPGSSSHP